MEPTESGLILLSAEEQRAFARAALHLRESCEMVLDLAQPISESEFMFLRVARAVVEGDQEIIDTVSAKIEERLQPWRLN